MRNISTSLEGWDQSFSFEPVRGHRARYHGLSGYQNLRWHDSQAMSMAMVESDRAIGSRASIAFNAGSIESCRLCVMRTQLERSFAINASISSGLNCTCGLIAFWPGAAT